MIAAIKRLVPAKFRGEIAPNYFVDPKNGEIWSNKRGDFKNLKWRACGNSPYPALVFRINDESISVRVHRIVAETMHNIPIPPGVSEKEWKRTPASVKRLFDQFWEVNHKDHNRLNFNPKNLEWVSRQENVQKYHQHVAKRK